jgi:hypothetical protein
VEKVGSFVLEPIMMFKPLLIKPIYGQPNRTAHLRVSRKSINVTSQVFQGSNAQPGYLALKHQSIEFCGAYRLVHWL